MKFKLTYEIDTETMYYRIKLEDKGLTDRETYRACAIALCVMESHLLHAKPAPTSIH